MQTYRHPFSFSGTTPCVVRRIRLDTFLYKDANIRRQLLVPFQTYLLHGISFATEAIQYFAAFTFPVLLSVTTIKPLSLSPDTADNQFNSFRNYIRVMFLI